MMHLLILRLLFVFCNQAQAQVTTQKDLNKFDGKKIASLEIEGLRRIEKDAVLAKIKTKAGGKIDLEMIRADIKVLFEMGYFQDIGYVSNSASNAQDIKLVLQLKERPVISELKFDGNERIESSDLKDVIKVKQWSILDESKVRQDTALIQKHYEDKGFYLTKVSYEIQKHKDDEVKLTYKIKDYDKVRIKKITFLNNKIFSDDALKKVFQEIREGDLLSFISSSGNFKELGLKQDLQRLTYWYLDHGYVKFRFENPIVTVSDDKKWLYVSIYVEEGEQYKMGDVDFEGDLLFPKQELASELTLLKSEVFRISQRNNDIQHLTEKYQDLGYAFTNVIPKMNIHDDTKTLDINYQFEKGNIVYFGEIRIIGNTKTYDKVIRRELRVHEGELYNGTNLRVSKERVERLGYFAPGEVIFNSITPKGKPGILDLEIQVKERSTGTITLGAGYGTVQKFFLTTQISEINLLGRGQTLSFQAQYANDKLQRSFNLGFTEPYTLDTEWSSGFDVFYVQYRIPGRYVVRKNGADVRFGHPIVDDVNAYITYKIEDLNVTIRENTEIDSSLDEGLLSSAIFSIVRDKRDNRFETANGSYQSISAEYAGILVDTKHFIKGVANNRFYKQIVGDLIFKNNTEIGAIAQTTQRGTPPSEKFFLGGPNNMKGYQILSLGPKKKLNQGEETLGGNFEAFSLFELEYPLIREAGVKWVMFFDAGNSYESLPGTKKLVREQNRSEWVTEPFTLRTDVGFGVRWFSPIGPLRFEWGFPLAKKPGEDNPVFQFFIGPPF